MYQSIPSLTIPSTDEGRRETGENRGGRREIMTEDKEGIIGREKKNLKNPIFLKQRSTDPYNSALKY